MGGRGKRLITPIYSEYGAESLELRPTFSIGFINSGNFALPLILVFSVIIKEGENRGLS